MRACISHLGARHPPTKGEPSGATYAYGAGTTRPQDNDGEDAARRRWEAAKRGKLAKEEGGKDHTTSFSEGSAIDSFKLSSTAFGATCPRKIEY